MRADTTLFASLLAATAAAQNYTGASNETTSIDNSYSNNQVVKELEAEIAALKSQIETAEHETCDATPAAPAAGGNAPSSASGAKPAASSSEPPFYTGNEGKDDAPSKEKPQGYTGMTNGGSDSKPSGDKPAGDKPVDTESEDNESTGSAPPAYGSDSSDKPATTQAPSYESGSNEGSDMGSNQGSNEGSDSDYTKPDGQAEQHGNYYAPNAPSSGAKSTSTKTVIVTKGQTETVSQTQTLTRTATEAEATEGGDVDVVTATETYCGKGAVPSPPSQGSGSGSGSGSNNGAGASSAAGSKPTSGSPAGHASSALSSVINSGKPSASSMPEVISSTQGYFNNGTASATGSGYVPTGMLTSTRGSSAMGSLTTSASQVVRPVTSSGASNGLPGTGVSSGLPGTAVSSSTSSAASPSATGEIEISDCATFCEELTTFNGWDVTPMTCTQRPAGVAVDSPSGQSSVGCAASFTPEVDLCQVTLNVATSGSAETYMEVWLPNGNETSWNGRSMNTDNGGLNGCIHYVDMQYVTGLGFAAIGDNAGHNGSSFDGTWTMNNNEAIIDWSYRARHAAVEVGKETIDNFYSKPADYSYYIGCSAGGAQGVQSAEKYPEDFDGIIAGAAANDFNHLQGWSATFRTITGASGNDTFLTQAEWTIVQTYVLEQCDEAIDGVADGILEDPTQCKFDVTAIPTCSGDDDTSECLSATQKQTVEDVFKPLYSADGALIYPALFPGSQVDAFRLGLLSGNPQGIARDWFRGAVYNDSSYDITTIDAEDIALAQSQDDLHGNPSAFSAELGAFRDAGRKFMMYHGMADPMTSGGNAQRYYLKLADRLGLSNTEIDEFFRLFRISGMAHCGVGGISGAGAWQFGQNGAAASATNNIVSNLVDWVENDNAPETLLGTKFWYDTADMGIMFERPHCRFPYRTTYTGGEDGDSTLPSSWGCEMIENWQDCADEFCSADGTFT